MPKQLPIIQVRGATPILRYVLNVLTVMSLLLCVARAGLWAGPQFVRRLGQT